MIERFLIAVIIAATVAFALVLSQGPYRHSHYPAYCWSPKGLILYSQTCKTLPYPDYKDV